MSNFARANSFQSTSFDEALLWVSAHENPLIDSLIFETLTITMIPGLEFDFILTIERPSYYFPCHKQVLASKSQVFLSFFAANPSIYYYKLGQYLDRSTILLWLQYLYNHNMDLSGQEPSTMVQLLALSCRYAVTELADLVCHLIMRRLNYRTALEFYSNFTFITSNQISDYVHINRVYDRCLSTIDRYGIVALLQPSLNDCNATLLSSIIRRDTLRVVEWTLFATLMHWAEVKCRQRNLSLSLWNIRQHLGDNLYLIRFPLMRITELYSIKLSGLVLQEEEYENILNTILDRPWSGEVNPRSIFSSKPRSALGWFIERFKTTKLVAISSFPWEIHQIDLIVNQRIRLIGVGIFAPSFLHLNTCKSFINLQIWNSDIDERVIDVHRRVVHGFTTSRNVYRIVFTSCVYLCPNVRYSLVLVIRHTNLQVSHRELFVVSGCKGKSGITVEVDGQRSLFCKIKPVKKRLDTFLRAQNGSSHRRGQFPEIIFDTD